MESWGHVMSCVGRRVLTDAKEIHGGEMMK